MYPSTSDLVAASTVDALTALTGPQQDALRTAAITAVETHCGQRFISEGTEADPIVKRVDGSGSNTLYLPVRLSLLSAVLATDASLGGVTVSDDRMRLTIGGNGHGGSWVDRAYADLRGHREIGFPSGVDNIKISGVWGWTDEEYTAELDAVTTALRMDMEDKALAGANYLADTVRASRALGVSNVSQGRLSINLAAVEPDLSVRAQRQLADLVVEHVGGATV